MRRFTIPFSILAASLNLAFVDVYGEDVPRENDREIRYQIRTDGFALVLVLLDTPFVANPYRLNPSELEQQVHAVAAAVDLFVNDLVETGKFDASDFFTDGYGSIAPVLTVRVDNRNFRSLVKREEVRYYSPVVLRDPDE